MLLSLCFKSSRAAWRHAMATHCLPCSISLQSNTPAHVGVVVVGGGVLHWLRKVSKRPVRLLPCCINTTTAKRCCVGNEVYVGLWKEVLLHSSDWGLRRDVLVTATAAAKTQQQTQEGVRRTEGCGMSPETLVDAQMLLGLCFCGPLLAPVLFSSQIRAQG